MKTWLAITVALATLVLYPANAWEFSVYTDAEVGQKAEWIVLAHVKEGSIEKILHGSKNNYEHRAALVVSRVIKGEVREKELRITIHYGLFPVSARYEKDLANDSVTVLSKPSEEPGETVKIYENNAKWGFTRPSGDVHQEQIWMLRHVNSPAQVRGHADFDTIDLPGIWEPEDIQPPTKEQQLSKYLPVR